jgi:anaphase-promoting complex subunit 6
MDDAGLQLLRDLALDCMAKHMYDAAIFYADKLVTLTEEEPLPVRQQAVFTLASAFFVDRQYRRCLQLLRTSELIETDVRFRHLAARWAARPRDPAATPPRTRQLPTDAGPDAGA